MALDRVPWSVGGGAEHTPETARAQTYAATTGAEGIAGVTDLRVQAQGTPNNTVQVLPGGGLLLNRYAGGQGQSYTLRAGTATDVTIAKTTSAGGRTDAIVLRVFDPQYEGNPLVDVNTFDYARLVVIQGVPAGTKYTKDLNLDYPGILLATVAIPASTATITNAMITDRRTVAQPRTRRMVFTVFPTSRRAIPGTYASWPINEAQRPTVRVPDWATEVDIIANISGAKFEKGNAVDYVAGIRTGFANTLPSQNGIIVQDAEDTNGRYHYSLVGTHKIAAGIRGTDQYVNLQAQRTGSTGNVYADYQTSVSIDLWFVEGPQ